MDWNSIETAPRDGQKVRLKGDDGKTFKGGFAEPHWWMIAPGVRIADGHLFAFLGFEGLQYCAAIHDLPAALIGETDCKAIIHPWPVCGSGA